MKHLILLCLLIQSWNLYAKGGVDGGGGNGVVCRDQAGAITSVRMLDLYEGEILHSLQFSDNFTDIESALKELAIKMKQPFLEYSFLAAYRSFKFLPKGVRLEPIDDSGHIFIPRDCKIEQLANYYNPSSIYVVSDFFEKMSLTDQVALVVHEALYANERAMGVDNSRYARRVTAYALADNFDFEDPQAGAPTKKGLLCYTPTAQSGNNRLGNYVMNENLTRATSFWAIPLAGGHHNWRFQFLHINGHAIYSKTYIDVNIDKKDFNFPLESLVNKAPTDNQVASFSTLKSNIDNGMSFGYELKNTMLNLDMFTGVVPRPGPWMNKWSSQYMTLSWVGFDPNDKVENAQFLCSEVTLFPEDK
jgi:hypothetical protein